MHLEETRPTTPEEHAPAKERLKGLQEGPEMRALLAQCLTLYDKLADVMAK